MIQNVTEIKANTTYGSHRAFSAISDQAYDLSKSVKGGGEVANILFDGLNKIAASSAYREALRVVVFARSGYRLPWLVALLRMWCKGLMASTNRRGDNRSPCRNPFP